MAITDDEMRTAGDILARADIGERQHVAFMMALADAKEWRAGRIVLSGHNGRDQPNGLMLVTTDVATIRRVRQLLADLEAEEDATELMERARQLLGERAEQIAAPSNGATEPDPLTARWYPPEGGDDGTRP